jgi:hypothetical protein
MISTPASCYAGSNNINKELEMAKTRRIIAVVSTALILAAIVALWGARTPASAQGQILRSNSATGVDCSLNYHAGASDGDRFTSIQGEIPETGGDSQALSAKDCSATRYTAASDGDRFASLHWIVSSQETGLPGPTAKDCFSDRFHAASDCDRLAAARVSVPNTGAGLLAPTTKDCFTNRFHSASDCDRLASDLPGQVTGQPSP